MKKTAYFANAEQALYWLMEQKRQSYNIKTTSFDYDNSNKVEKREPTLSELLRWSGVYQYPQSVEETAMVVSQLDKIFNTLPKRTKVILMLSYLGDFASPEIHKKATNSQKLLKAKGYRAILSYKYQKIKVAKLLNIDRKTVTRHHQKANEVFTDKLLENGFVAQELAS